MTPQSNPSCTEPCPLVHDEIASRLNTRWLGHKLVIYKSTASTSDLARRYLNDPKAHGLTLLAEHQSAGRGRRGNTWLAKPGQSILASIILKNIDLNPELLSLTIPAALHNTLSEISDPPLQIKWPNDIVAQTRKLAGVLIESPLPGTWIVGIGINCLQQPEDFHPLPEGSAVSLQMLTKHPICRSHIAAGLLNTLEQTLIDAKNNPQKIINLCKTQSALLNQRITLEYENQAYTGQCIDIDPLHGLVLVLDRGPLKAFEAYKTHNIQWNL